MVGAREDGDCDDGGTGTFRAALLLWRWHNQIVFDRSFLLSLLKQETQVVDAPWRTQRTEFNCFRDVLVFLAVALRAGH